MRSAALTVRAEYIKQLGICLSVALGTLCWLAGSLWASSRLYAWVGHHLAWPEWYLGWPFWVVLITPLWISAYAVLSVAAWWCERHPGEEPSEYRRRTRGR